ncbi:MAG: FAD:protein FMN transferase [Planctomycetia bacterium]|nr:FAD:protein FMN transferase [Planctomycetia bacterium]
MRFNLFILFFFLFSSFVAANEPECNRFEFLESKMGVPVRIVLFAENEALAQQGADAVYRRFDELNAIMSDYDPESEIVQLCRKSDSENRAIFVSPELQTVLTASRAFNELSEGAFDITVSPVVKLWRRSRMFKTLPPSANLERAKELVGNNNWTISDNQVRILKKGVRFDLGGIAKGFALDEALKVLEDLGINSVLVDAGGDVRVGNSPPDKEGWTIGIASLDDDAKPAFYISLKNAAVATSGDTFQFFEIDSVRYSHIIDPRSGEPLTGHSVISVIAPNAITADALASAMNVLEPEKSLSLAEKLDQVEVLIFRLKNNELSTTDFEVYSTDFFHSYLSDKNIEESNGIENNRSVEITP